MEHKCVNCGYCCRKSACGYGDWNFEKKQCNYLTIDNLCGKYDEIIKDPSSIVSPAFGAGCCMPLFNSYRNEKIKELMHTVKEIKKQAK